MNSKKKFNSVLFLVVSVFFTIFGLGNAYKFSTIINLLIMLGGFGLYITYRYFVKSKVLQYVMHGLVAFSTLFNFIITIIFLTDAGSIAVLSGLFDMFFIIGLSLVYAFYYLLDDKCEDKNSVKEEKTEEKKEDDTVNSEIK